MEKGVSVNTFPVTGERYHVNTNPFLPRSYLSHQPADKNHPLAAKVFTLTFSI